MWLNTTGLILCFIVIRLTGGTEGYGVDFELAQYDRIAGLARTIKGKMIISVNDIPEMRKAFDGLMMETVAITYTVGGNHRNVQRSELIIRNFWLSNR